MPKSDLVCRGIGRDKDCISALQLYFHRRVTDYEMRFLYGVMRRAAACMPADPTVLQTPQEIAREALERDAKGLPPGPGFLHSDADRLTAALAALRRIAEMEP